MDLRPNLRRRTFIAWSALLIALAIINVIDWPSMFMSGDPTVWREETRNLLQRGTLAVDADIAEIGEYGQWVVVNPKDEHSYSKYGVMNSIMALPPVWLDQKLYGPRALLQPPKLAIFNAWNTILSLLLAVTLLRLASLYTDRFLTQAIFVLATFFGTFLWFYARAQSSEIYQTLFFSIVFLMLVEFFRDRRRWRLLIVWLFVGALVLTRLSFLLLIPLVIALLVIGTWRTSRFRFWPDVLLPALLIVFIAAWVNKMKFGSPFASGYHVWRPADHLPTGRLSDGLWGFLFLPRFSIFTCFPTLLFAAFTWRTFYRRFRADALIALTIALAFLLVLSKVPTWAGEWSLGPRYLLFVLPALSLPFILFIDEIIQRRRVALALVAGACIAYSGYLVFRVNQLDFFAYYMIREPAEKHWSDTVAGYFRDHHTGTVIDDLLRHRNDPDSLPWFAEMKTIWPESTTDAERAEVHRLLKQGNHFWWTDPSARESG